jgi:hypothetical protein
VTSSRVATPVTSKRAPPRSLATARTVQPWASTISRTIASPIPVPSVRVERDHADVHPPDDGPVRRRRDPSQVRVDDTPDQTAAHEEEPDRERVEVEAAEQIQHRHDAAEPRGGHPGEDRNSLSPEEAGSDPDVLDEEPRPQPQQRVRDAHGAPERDATLRLERRPH